MQSLRPQAHKHKCHLFYHLAHPPPHPERQVGQNTRIALEIRLNDQYLLSHYCHVIPRSITLTECPLCAFKYKL